MQLFPGFRILSISVMQNVSIPWHMPLLVYYCSLSTHSKGGRRDIMARSVRTHVIKALGSQKVEDYMWGMPESPEFSSVQGLMNEFQSHANHEERWLSSYKELANESSDPLIRFSPRSNRRR
jgi:hypothetical protein